MQKIYSQQFIHTSCFVSNSSVSAVVLHIKSGNWTDQSDFLCIRSWQYMGYQFVIIYSAANSIPTDYIEASRIDGATRWQTNFYIILPMLRDTLRNCLIFAVTGGFNIYSQMQLLTQGGPGTATYSLTYMTFRSAFKLRKYVSGFDCSY